MVMHNNTLTHSLTHTTPRGVHWVHWVPTRFVTLHLQAAPHLLLLPSLTHLPVPQAMETRSVIQARDVTACEREG